MIDLLLHNAADCPRFTVTNSGFYVHIISGSDVGIMRNSEGKKFFQKGDGFTVLSAGYKLMLGFETFNPGIGVDQSNMLAFKIKARYGAGFIQNKILNPGKIAFPFDCYELSMNSFYNAIENGISTKNHPLYALQMPITGADSTDLLPVISVINVPEILIGKTLLICPFLKIEHTLEMVSE